MLRRSAAAILTTTAGGLAIAAIGIAARRHLGTGASEFTAARSQSMTAGPSRRPTTRRNCRRTPPRSSSARRRCRWPGLFPVKTARTRLHRCRPCHGGATAENRGSGRARRCGNNPLAPHRLDRSRMRDRPLVAPSQAPNSWKRNSPRDQVYRAGTTGGQMDYDHLDGGNSRGLGHEADPDDLADRVGGGRGVALRDEGRVTSLPMRPTSSGCGSLVARSTRMSIASGWQRFARAISPASTRGRFRT